MAMQLIQVTAPADRIARLDDLVADRPGVFDKRIREDDGKTQTLSILAGPHERQRLLDDLQRDLDPRQDWRIVVLPVEATVPKPEEPKEAETARSRLAAVATREELYNGVARGARADANYVLLVCLSTVVAAVGMSDDNPAVVIGAMVIAPLLGPNLAFILATALGDRALAGRAAASAAIGLAVVLVLSILLGLLAPLDLESAEIVSRTDMKASSVVLALASGAAAALSMTTGLSSALVGVMVAVALLPPATVAGLMIAAGAWPAALGAGLLLATNVVCINLSGQIIFALKRIRPRTWLEKRSARQSVVVSLAIWAICLLALIAIFLVRARLA